MKVAFTAHRMLWDKGIKEFVAAAQLLKENYFESLSALWMVDLDNKEGLNRI
jgi:hypothetical protein